MTKNALVVGLALAILSVRGAAVKAQKPDDACALLLAAEIQVLAGTGKVGAGQASTDPLGSRLCRYEWGTGGNVLSGRSILDVSVTSTAKAYPGTDPSLVRQGLLATVKADDPNTAVIAGVGDAAIYQSNAPIRATTTAAGEGERALRHVPVGGRTREEGPSNRIAEGGGGASVETRGQRAG